MPKKEADILQIRKYLNGELDDKAMHRLERQAQNDPFLMDALEGYQSIGVQQKHLNELNARLKKRIELKRGRVIPFRFLSIAASVLVICSAGIWWFYRNNPVTYKTKTLATNVTLSKPTDTPAGEVKPAIAPVVKTLQKNEIAHAEKRQASHLHPTVLADQAITEKPAAQREIQGVKSKPNGNAGYIAPADSTPVDEMIVMEYKPKKTVDTSLFVRKAIKSADKNPIVQQLPGKAPGVTIQSNSNNSANLAKLAGQGGDVGRLAMNQLINSQSISGRVIAKDDGLPIQGASVKIAGTNKATQTDADGRFHLKGDTSRSKLVIAGIGYQTRQVSSNNRDSVKNISLEPSSSNLNEVVVTGYTSVNKDADEETTVVNAHPVDGWAELKKYLKTNAVSPDHQIGVVKLSFMVDRFGGISTIRVIKGISPATDKKAISLVRNGPGWTGNSTKQPEMVTLRIRFN